MLLPVLRKVRQKGQEISCLSNLRMSGTALNYYATDYNMFFPSYMYNPSVPYYSWAEWMYQLKYLPYASPVTACPLAETKPLTLADNGKGGKFHEGVYGIYYRASEANNNVIIETPVAGGCFKVIKLTRLSKSSVFPVLADSAKNEDDLRQFYVLSLHGSGYEPHMRHQNRCNVYFADGHASSNTPRQYYDNLMESDLNLTSGFANGINYFDKNGIGQTFSEFIE
jgi:prepilin-type processing-associated H-X9-DG protein